MLIKQIKIVVMDPAVIGFQVELLLIEIIPNLQGHYKCEFCLHQRHKFPSGRYVHYTSVYAPASSDVGEAAAFIVTWPLTGLTCDEIEEVRGPEGVDLAALAPGVSSSTLCCKDRVHIICYTGLFSSCRYADLHIAGLVTYTENFTTAVVVVRNNHFRSFAP